ncbi:hypothetical protein ScPMuIL_009166 [Solemya velum]
MDFNFEPISSNRRSQRSDILKKGCLKKLKTMKKKFFVLRSTSNNGPARLEYYDNEKKFNAGNPAKRTLELYKCFNINKNCDTKHKHVIALYIKDHCFSVIAEDVADQESWMNLMLEYQNDFTPSCKQHYDYIWTVSIKEKGLGKSRNMSGHFRFCVTENWVDFVRVNSEESTCTVRLSEIRRCGHSDNFFFMEVGRSAVTGHGEFWMQTDDKEIAQHMHEVVLNCMKTVTSTSVMPINASRTRCTTMGNDDGQIRPKNRPRTVSDSQHQRSPHRGHSDKRSSAINVKGIQRPNPLMPEAPIAIPSSPISPIEFPPPSSFRSRADSAGSKESRSSRSIISMEDEDPVSNHTPGYQSVSSVGSVTPELAPKSVSEDTDGYFLMGPGHRSSTPSPTRQRPERPGSSGSESQESGVRSDSYVDMNPCNSVGSGGNDSGYMDMSTGPTVTATPSSSLGMCSSLPASHKEMVQHLESPYHFMGPGLPTSAPIPIRSGNKDPGYIDMGQHLPTVKEGGSGEAYLPMSPHEQSPKVSAKLKPDRVISYLSDDSMSGEFPAQRAYSVGSRPIPKTAHRSHLISDIRQPVSDNGRSSSAPHLIVQKPRSPLVNDSSLSASPLSYSLRSDDSDSFMEMEFCRPRTGSDSYGCRPRSSSFGKVFAQGHRPRSSSYGQAARLKLGSFESVRTTSTELLRKRSQDSVRKASPLSSQASSTESLRKLSEEISSQTSEYVDMGINDKSNTPSPKVPHSASINTESNSYVDMTFGTHSKPVRSSSGWHSASKIGTSPSSASSLGQRKLEVSQPESKVIKATSHMIQKPNVSVKSKYGMNFQSGVPIDPGGIDRYAESHEPLLEGHANLGISEQERQVHEDELFPHLYGHGVMPMGYANLDVHDEDTPLESRVEQHPPSISPHKPTSSSHGSGRESEDESYVPFEPGCSVPQNTFSPTDVSSLHHHQNKSHPEEQWSKKSHRERGDSVNSKTSQVDKCLSAVHFESGDQGNCTPDSTYMFFDPEPFKDTVKTSASSIETSVTVPPIIPSKSEKVEVARPVSTADYMTFDPIFKPADYLCGIDTKTSFTPKSHTVQSHPSKKSDPKFRKTTTGSTVSDTSKDKHKSKKHSSKHKNKGSRLSMSKEEIPSGYSDKSELIFPAKITGIKKEVVNEAEIDITPKQKTGGGEDDGYVDLDIHADVKISPPNHSLEDFKAKCFITERKDDTSKDISFSQKTGNVKSEHKVSSDKNVIQCFQNSSGDKVPLVPLEEKETDVKSGARSRSSTDPFIDLLGKKNDTELQMDSSICSGSDVGQSRSRQSSGNSTSSKNGESNLCIPSSSALRKAEPRLGKADTLTTPGTELQKQNSMPCITPPVGKECEESPPVKSFDNNPRSRHSFTDISEACERMSFTSDSILSQQTSSGPQLSSSDESSKKLNYASLDLGSGDSVDQGDPYSPRIRSRHPSTIENNGPPSSYAQIDFKKSESLRNSGNKDVKFTL